MTNQGRKEIPVWEKYLLSIDEAAAYFGIGEKRIRALVSIHRDSPTTFAVEVGNHIFINKKKFEAFIDMSTTI